MGDKYRVISSNYHRQYLIGVIGEEVDSGRSRGVIYMNYAKANEGVKQFLRRRVSNIMRVPIVIAALEKVEEEDES